MDLIKLLEIINENIRLKKQLAEALNVMEDVACANTKVLACEIMEEFLQSPLMKEG